MNMALTSKQEAAKFLAEVPPEYAFWCQDGRTLRDMKELGKALATMTDETYNYHANMAKNDFSTWVRDVIGDDTLASNLQKALDRAQAASQTTRRVGVLTKKLG
jgi:hypothetical protein